MQNLQSQMSEMLARTAPKPQSFSEKVASNEKAINQKIDTVSHGDFEKANVSAPSLNVKHLSD